MRLTVTTEHEQSFLLEVSPEMELQDLQALIEAESNIPTSRQVLIHNGKQLNGANQQLAALGLQNEDFLLLALARPTNTPASSSRPRTTSNQPSRSQQTQQQQQQDPNDPYVIREMIRTDPHLLANLRYSDPALADAAMEETPTRFLALIQERQKEKAARDQQELALLTADPFDVEAQRKIEERIQAQNIAANLETAMEYNPEAFGTVVMLYIDVLVNKVPVKAFVDSGAQMTIMSDTCAEKCGIMRLVDKRFAGIARGVGHAKILGKVHSADVKVADHFLPCSFSVMEKQPMDMLIGLDFLKRFQCCIDLKKNVLLIGTTNTETPFLSEKDLPLSARPGGSDLTDEERSTLLGEGALPTPTTNSTSTSSSTSARPQQQQQQQPQQSSLLSQPQSQSQPQPPSQQQQPQQQQQQQQQVNEANIATLTGLGFTRTQVLEALRATNNNVELAASYLFSMLEY